jgi:hypothetical protein
MLDEEGWKMFQLGLETLVSVLKKHAERGRSEYPMPCEKV